MPILGKEKLETLELPSGTADEPATVTLDLNITSGQAEDFDAEQDKSQATYALILSCIKSWNYTDADGQLAPLTVENLRMLPNNDMKVIANKVFTELDSNLTAQVVSSDEKKAS